MLTLARPLNQRPNTPFTNSTKLRTFGVTCRPAVYSKFIGNTGTL